MLTDARTLAGGTAPVSRRLHRRGRCRRDHPRPRAGRHPGPGAAAREWRADVHQVAALAADGAVPTPPGRAGPGPRQERRPVLLPAALHAGAGARRVLASLGRPRAAGRAAGCGRLRERDGLPDHGWPFDREALDPFYERAQRVCNLGPFEYDVDPWERVAWVGGCRSTRPVSTPRCSSSDWTVPSTATRHSSPTPTNVELLLHATVTRIAVDRHGRVDHAPAAPRWAATASRSRRTPSSWPPARSRTPGCCWSPTTCSATASATSTTWWAVTSWSTPTWRWGAHPGARPGCPRPPAVWVAADRPTSQRPRHAPPQRRSAEQGGRCSTPSSGCGRPIGRPLTRRSDSARTLRRSLHHGVPTTGWPGTPSGLAAGRGRCSAIGRPNARRRPTRSGSTSWRSRRRTPSRA